MTAQSRHISARIAALSKHSRLDGREATSAARGAFLQRFYDEVDPDGVLPGPERERRATIARKLYFVRLAAKSAEARRRAPRS